MLPVTSPRAAWGSEPCVSAAASGFRPSPEKEHISSRSFPQGSANAPQGSLSLTPAADKAKLRRGMCLPRSQYLHPQSRQWAQGVVSEVDSGVKMSVLGVEPLLCTLTHLEDG